MQTIDVVNLFLKTPLVADEEVEEFIRSFHASLGHDGTYVSGANVSRAVRSGVCDDWRSLAWACREQISFCSDYPLLTEDDFLHFMMMSCLIGEAVRRLCFDWDGTLDIVVGTLANNMEICDSSFRAQFLRFLLQ